MSIDTIKNRIKIINDLQDEVKKIKAHYKESLENDPRYQEVQEKKAKIREESNVVNERVRSSSTLQKMEQEIKEMSDDIKDQKEMLAQELADHYKDTGEMKITDPDGNEKRVVFSAKLVSA